MPNEANLVSLRFSFEVEATAVELPPKRDRLLPPAF